MASKHREIVKESACLSTLSSNIQNAIFLISKFSTRSKIQLKCININDEYCGSLHQKFCLFNHYLFAIEKKLRYFIDRFLQFRRIWRMAQKIENSFVHSTLTHYRNTKKKKLTKWKIGEKRLVCLWSFQWTKVNWTLGQTVPFDKAGRALQKSSINIPKQKQ